MKNGPLLALTLATALLTACVQRGGNGKYSNQSNITDTVEASENDASTVTIDFSMNDINGHKVNVKDVFNMHKITIVDFWASWCGPCRREIPNLVATYNKFKNKGLGIVGVSLDEERSDWTSAVENFNMTWTQLSDLKGWDNSAALKYGINSIPFTIIVDQEGKVITTGLTGGDLEAFVCHQLGY